MIAAFSQDLKLKFHCLLQHSNLKNDKISQNMERLTTLTSYVKCTVQTFKDRVN